MTIPAKQVHPVCDLPPKADPPFAALDRRSPWPWVASLVLHAVLLTAIVTAVSRPLIGTTEATVRTVGLAIAHQLPDRARYAPIAKNEPAIDSSEASAAALAASSPVEMVTNETPASPPPGFTPPLDFDGLLAEMLGQGTTDLGTSGTGSAGELRLGDGQSVETLSDEALVPGAARFGQGGGQTTTSVFGISGTGSVFVYVFDRSESMTGAALRRAKSELVASLKTLSERQQFQVIFYNESPMPFTRGGLVLGESANVARACGYIESVTASGGTEHEAALQMALRLAPDVVFFLTDAKIQTMSAAAQDAITRRAEDAGTVIHAIQFGTGPPDPSGSFVRDLARRNRGGYQYVDTEGF